MIDEYIIPCMASFFLGVGVTLVFLSAKFKEPANKENGNIVNERR